MENILEWTKCLLSPKYAQTTYLRITPKREKELLLLLKRVVIGLFIAATLAGFFAAYRFGQYMQAKRMANSQTYQIEIPRGTPVFTN